MTLTPTIEQFDMTANADRNADEDDEELDLEIVDLGRSADAARDSVGAKSGGSSGCGYWVGESNTPASTQ
jgi:hypothetical protein